MLISQRQAQKLYRKLTGYSLDASFKAIRQLAREKGAPDGKRVKVLTEDVERIATKIYLPPAPRKHISDKQAARLRAIGI